MQIANLKHSKQRDAILEFLMTRKDHPTADTVYQNVREQFPNISLGTVYRNLTLLAEIGQIQKIAIGNGADHFDACTDPHYHFICIDCGSVQDLPVEEIDFKDKIISSGFDGSITRHITYFYGHCGECERRRKSLKKSSLH